MPPEELYEDEIEDHWVQVRDDLEINTLSKFASSEISPAMEEPDRSGIENESLGSVIDYHMITSHRGRRRAYGDLKYQKMKLLMTILHHS